jgi:esterase/lipase
MAQTRAQKNRAIRKDEIRAYLAERGRVEYVFDNIEKIEQLDANSQGFHKELLKIKTANDQRIRMLNKYLPDVKEEVQDYVDLPPMVIKLANDAAD